ncbi:MAG: sialate O-acetylesterase [Rubripirellula sp.]|nr:sialate O-acetylesterase [Planctomycetaceae bacterium]MDF1843073.1 sialate O-acetylesterase [Rubripirellula sp.]
MVKNAASGQSIRTWCKSNHEFPHPSQACAKDQRQTIRSPAEKTQSAIANETLQRVTLVWMQGESDLNNSAYDAYLTELLEQLRSDLRTCPKTHSIMDKREVS